MNIDEWAPQGVHTPGGGETPPCAELTPNALPEVRSTIPAESSPQGVSTKNAQTAPPPQAPKPQNAPSWYALRTTYGREKKAYDYLTSQGITAFHPTIRVVKLINGKRRKVTESLLPNIFFAYGSEAQLKTFVYDNVNLPYLRFYYRHVHVGRRIEKIPLIIPDSQMHSLQVICTTDADTQVVPSSEASKFEKGQLVKVIDGAFKGVIGRVARYQGQHRVGVVIDDLATVCTAYVSKAFCFVLGDCDIYMGGKNCLTKLTIAIIVKICNDYDYKKGVHTRFADSQFLDKQG